VLVVFLYPSGTYGVFRRPTDMNKKTPNPCKRIDPETGDVCGSTDRTTRKCGRLGDCKACKRRMDAKYRSKPENKAKQAEYMVEYVAKPEAKARRAELRTRPEAKVKAAALNAAWYDKNRAKQAERRASPEGKAKQAKSNAEFKVERDAYRNLLLLSLGVTDLSQEYDFHHVIGRQSHPEDRRPDTIATLLSKKSTWEQAWEEAHTFCVVMTKAEHTEYHRTHKMQEDGTFTVRPGVQTPIT